MRIGYFTHSGISTSETFIYDLIVGLQKAGLQVIFYSGETSVNQVNDLMAIPTGYANRGKWLVEKIYKLGQILNGKGLLYQHRVRSWIAFKSLQKKIGTDTVDVAYIDYGTSAVILRKYLNANHIPYIVHFHGYDITSALNDPVYFQNLRLVFEEAVYLIAASDHIKRLLVLTGCNSEKIHVIRLGVDTESIKPLDWSERVRSNPKLIFLGRLTKKKNPIALLHAFKIVNDKIKSATLTIIGDGPLREQVIETINSLKLTQYVTLLGALPRNQSFPILNKHWIYVQHSVTAPDGDQEGFAISLAEAAAHELPVVSTLHNGIPENVIDGKTGYLVREFDYVTMADRIMYLIENIDEAKKMGIVGRNHIMQMCSTTERANSVKKLLQAAYNA